MFDDRIRRAARLVDTIRDRYVGGVHDKGSLSHGSWQFGFSPSPISSHSIDFPNSWLIFSKISAPISFSPRSIYERCP